LAWAAMPSGRWWIHLEAWRLEFDWQWPAAHGVAPDRHRRLIAERLVKAAMIVKLHPRRPVENKPVTTVVPSPPEIVVALVDHNGLPIVERIAM
jgi:hypothetical protein